MKKLLFCMVLSLLPTWVQAQVVQIDQNKILFGHWLSGSGLEQNSEIERVDLNITSDRAIYINGQKQVDEFRIFREEDGIIYALAKFNIDDKPSYNIIRFYLFPRSNTVSLSIGKCLIAVEESKYIHFNPKQLSRSMDDYRQSLCLVEEADYYPETINYWQQSFYHRHLNNAEPTDANLYLDGK